jgi:hypothetical protein
MSDAGLANRSQKCSHGFMLRNTLITRREALQHWSAGTLLALGLWPGALRSAERDRSGSFRFVVINDTHYMSDDCGRWLEQVVRQIKAGDPIDFCLHAGDLTENGRKADFAAVRDIFKGLGAPVFFSIGNHDYLNERFVATEPRPERPLRSSKDDRPWTAPAPQFDRRSYDQFFPGQRNFYFKHHGWQFVGLDTSMGTLYDKTTIQPDTFRWVEDHLPRLDKQLPMVIFTHFPLGPSVKYRPLNADALLERFKPYNLQAVFCGHWHGFTERHFGVVPVTTNKCCALKRDNHDGTKEKGWFLCTAGGGTITRTFVEAKSPLAPRKAPSD